MLNFRKLRHEYSSNILKEGKTLLEKKMVENAKMMCLTPQTIRVSARVLGNYGNQYTCELEIDRKESITIDSDCDCPHKYDCQHLAALLFYLEEHFDSILVAFSKETNLQEAEEIDEDEKKELLESVRHAESKEVVKKGKKFQKELLQEYASAATILGNSPYFIPEEEAVQEGVELGLIFLPNAPEVQLVLRLPFRLKPLNILNVKEFLDAVRYQDSIFIGNRRYFFSLGSFDKISAALLKMLLEVARFPDSKEERFQRFALIEQEAFGAIVAEIYRLSMEANANWATHLYPDHTAPAMPCLYYATLEEPLRVCHCSAGLIFKIEYLEAPAPKILLSPSILINDGKEVPFEEVRLFECAEPGMIYQQTYYRFNAKIKRKHLRNLPLIRQLTIPEPLFGTFVENSLPELSRYVEVSQKENIDRFVTLPFVGKLRAECDIHYLNKELEVAIFFLYDSIKIPVFPSELSYAELASFVTPQGILARNLVEEQAVVQELLQDFIFDPHQHVYVCKNDKKIIEFMTEIVPRNQYRVKFNCPENLLEQFIYDNSHFYLTFRESKRVDVYEVELKVDGYLNGVTVDLLWDCLSSRRAFVQLSKKRAVKKKGKVEGSASEGDSVDKVLILDLEKLGPVIQIFEEIGIRQLDDHVEERPLWSLANIHAENFVGLPVTFSISDRLQDIQKQMLGESFWDPSPIPAALQATLRNYQIEGVAWLEKLRGMHLNGILADDMGLGKTLQAIAAVTQQKLLHGSALSIIVCPTSLIYNWKEEFTRFNPHLKILPIDGTPTQRKKLIEKAAQSDVLITSYSLLQKDVDIYHDVEFSYVILDEAQNIKNRGTRNAKSVKQIHAKHRLILTGTPIENCLEELWSLFDFLMPGLLSTYERFVEKYIRQSSQSMQERLEHLRRKVSPFILRRMKKDVLTELPPISEIIYRCYLSTTQKQLYHSYAASAREELSQLVKREGFEKVQIHVLATLTRLKQICCHPAIFAKERPETGDSAKYEMLMELIQTLLDSQHKTVIFSQYTRMLGIIKEDLKRLGIPFHYLDGSSKNRMEIVRQFNEDEQISIFLVSLKAGGVGLNLVGADTVIHYDMWWNPAVENQATDRVHRIGQKNSVSSYKFVTLGTIEEKILELQQRKQGHAKKIISCDEEAIAKLTWEEVLELLQT